MVLVYYGVINNFALFNPLPAMSKVLYIDDNQIDHRIFQLMAARFDNFQSVSYTDAPECVIEYLASHGHAADKLPAKIVVDLHMRNNHGFQFLEAYNQLHEEVRENIEVYVISASISPRDMQRARDYSFVKDYLVKPLTPANFAELFNAA